jgi:hypothetical protein
MRPPASCALAALLCAGLVPAFAAPAPGAYDARLCVSLAAQPPSCGPAVAALSSRRLNVQVNDIAYRLRFPAHPAAGRVAVLVMHGTMQIDEFSAPFRWVERTLQFDDSDKDTRYEVQLGERLPQPK